MKSIVGKISYSKIKFWKKKCVKYHVFTCRWCKQLGNFQLSTKIDDPSTGRKLRRFFCSDRCFLTQRRWAFKRRKCHHCQNGIDHCIFFNEKTHNELFLGVHKPGDECSGLSLNQTSTLSKMNGLLKRRLVRWIICLMWSTERRFYELYVWQLVILHHGLFLLLHLKMKPPLQPISPQGSTCHSPSISCGWTKCRIS